MSLTERQARAHRDVWADQKRRAEAAEAEVARLRDALEACRKHLRHNHRANGGWWNDPAVYRLIREQIDPALGTHTD